MTSRRLLAAGVLALAAGAACRRAPAAGARPVDSLAGARTLVEQRKFDEAIQAIGNQADPDALYLLGAAWAGKAQAAPVPTPVPGSHGWAPMKPEESQALAFLERAVAARPDLAAAHLAIADLLAPHALAAHRRGGAAPGNSSVGRVLETYGRALQADPAGTAAVESLIRFATAAGRVADADGAFQELIRRRREDPDVLVRYGDFLAASARNPEGALAQYSQALIWRPDDAKTRLKVAGIHLDSAAALLEQREYAAAEARLGVARRFVADPASPEAARLREMDARLRDIRGR